MGYPESLDIIEYVKDGPIPTDYASTQADAIKAIETALCTDPQQGCTEVDALHRERRSTALTTSAVDDMSANSVDNLAAPGSA